MEEKIESIRYGEDLPGFRNIDYVPRNLSLKHLGNGLIGNLFTHALSADDHSAAYSKSSCEGRLTPLRELQMMRWMNVVTDKENWDVKAGNNE